MADRLRSGQPRPVTVGHHKTRPRNNEKHHFDTRKTLIVTPDIRHAGIHLRHTAE